VLILDISWVNLIIHLGAKLNCVIREGLALLDHCDLGTKNSREKNPTGLNERPMSLTGDYQPESLIASPVDERVCVGTDDGT